MSKAPPKGGGASQIREHMELVGSDGGRVGSVDKVHGDRIKLTREDPQLGGEHRYSRVSVVASVD